MPKKPVQNEAEYLREVIEISKELVSSLGLDEVLRKVLFYARELVDIPAGSIALFDEVSATMCLRLATDLSEESGSRSLDGRWQAAEAGLTQKILAQKDLFILEDTDRASDFEHSRDLGEGIGALIAVPLRTQDSLIGILYLNDFKPRSFDAAACEKLRILASFASLSIDNALQHDKVLDLASTDGLTGLFNHRQFKWMLGQEANRAQRYNSEFSLVMLDIDNFKSFNDRYGHPCGDKILVKVAELLKDVFRETDSVFRYGGEEFVVILPRTGPVAAAIAAERAREAIAAMRIAWQDVDHPLGVTVSVGVASLPHDAASCETLLKVADRLMYQAKNQGKNRVHTLKSIKSARKPSALSPLVTPACFGYADQSNC
jgi:diguanylate cyclase (GGDEF)-like protein